MWRCAVHGVNQLEESIWVPPRGASYLTEPACFIPPCYTDLKMNEPKTCQFLSSKSVEREKLRGIYSYTPISLAQKKIKENKLSIFPKQTGLINQQCN